MQRMRGALLIILICLSVSACGGSKPPQSPSSDSPSGEMKVTGRERIHWNQRAADTLELSTFRYAVYIDGVRSELTGVSCGSTKGSDGFECSAPLPRLTIGSHTLEMATFIETDGIYESDRTAPLRLSFAGLTSLPVQVVEQVQLSLQLITEGLSQPSDMAVTPDGAILIAERAGLVRVVRDGLLMPEPALDLSAEVPPEGGLLSLAVDRRFNENKLVYLLYAAGFSSRDVAFTLARFRSVNDRLGERAVLIDRIPASPRGPGGTVRMGSDGNLYVGLDDSGNGRVAPALGSFNGKILRTTPDALTPSDQAGASPVYSLDHP